MRYINHSWITLSLFFTLLFWQCDPIDVPKPDSSSPIFQLKATIDGDSLNWSADNGFFMETRFEIDSVDVHNFIGVFQEENCLNTCFPSFQLSMRDFQIVPSNQVNINQAVTQGDYSFFSNQVDTLGVVPKWTLTPIWEGDSIQIPDLYTWVLEDGSTFVTSATESLQFVAQDLNPILLDAIVDNQICNTSITKTISANSTDDMQVLITPSIIQGGSILQIQASVSGINQPASYIWDSGETTSGIIKTLNDTIPISEFHDVCLTVITSSGNTIQKCVRVTIESAPVGGADIIGFCQMDFQESFELEVQTGFDSLQFSTIVLEYLDENGNSYNSANIKQPINSFFEITSIEAFDNNANNLPTQKIDFRCRVLLADNNGQEQWFETAASTMAIAHPQ